MGDVGPNRSPSSRPFVTSPASVLGALFNQEGTSDLTLIVNDVRYHAHRAILAPISTYAQTFLDSPAYGKIKKRNTKAEIRIALPQIELPAYCANLHTKTSQNGCFFEIFLRVLYGLDSICVDRPAVLFAVAQIADFLGCDSLVVTCDKTASKIIYTVDNVLDVALFCQMYPLPKTFSLIKAFIALNMHTLSVRPQLYQLKNVHIHDIVLLPTHWNKSMFFMLFCYVTDQVPKDMANYTINLDDCLAIKDLNRRKFFQEVAPELIKKWDWKTLTDVAGFYEELRPNERMFDGCQEDQTFLYRMFTKAFLRFGAPPTANQ